MDIDAWYTEGKAAMRDGDVSLAIEKFEAVLSADGHHERALNLLSDLLLRQGDVDGALKYADQAIAVAPEQAAHHNQRGLALVVLGHLEEAEQAFMSATALEPNLATAHMNLAIVHAKQDRLAEAHSAMTRILELSPNDPSVLMNLGLIYRKLGRASEAARCLDRAYALMPQSLECAFNRLGALHYTDGRSTAEVADRTALYWELHDRFSQRPEPQTHRPVSTAARQKPLRVGYVSPDFRTHPVGRLMLPVLENHSRDRLYSVLYSNNTVEDETTLSLKSACDQWRNISTMSDQDAARSINDDAVDILVDLSGHTDGHRLGVFRHKPAPVQMTWLGFVATTGLEQIDYIIADRLVLPESDEPHYVEKPLRLPHSLLCYRPPDDLPFSRRSPDQEQQDVTFGCFNSIQKLNEELIQTWARILDQVPRSRMLIKYASLSNPDIFNSVQGLFHEYGIDPGRLILKGHTSYEGHMASYNTIDIALDTFPYAGTMTTLESLWMGVPVVTRKGDTWASRVGASLLTTAGLTDLIAATEDAYVEKAIALANDAKARADLNSTLRSTLLRSPLCDAASFTQSLETLYQTAWETWCEQG